MRYFLFYIIIFNFIFFLYTSNANSSMEANTRVRFNMNVALADGTSSFEVELFDNSSDGVVRTTPNTVANFLNYIEKGLYDGTIFHRLVDGFVLQGGGYSWPSFANYQAGGVPLPVEKDNPILNEPGNLNVLGTLAMAKVSGDPNSATSEWFINLVDNPNLDNVNGGFTVFGRVTSGIELINQISSLVPYNLSGLFYYYPPFNEMPVQGTLQSVTNANSDYSYTVVLPSNYIAIESVEILNRNSGQLKVFKSEDLTNWSEVNSINLKNLGPNESFLKAELSLED